MSDQLHDVFVVDDQIPEDMAMLQALYSRSPASVVTHLDKLKQSGSGKFMDQYYVGYGHASIGDCGTTTCFIEQVSMLVAKAFQDNPLYNGQEASTRYLDFTKQSIVDPYNTPETRAIQDAWNALYTATLPKLIAALEARYPFSPTDYKNERIWSNTIQARAFDIARSLLPIGTTTLLSWTTSLRQARDNLRRLKHHPSGEVRTVAQTVFKKLVEKYPHSFKGDEMDTKSATPRDLYAQRFASQNHYQSADDLIARFELTEADRERLHNGELFVDHRTLDMDGLRRMEADTLAERANGTALPSRLESYGRYNFLFLLDFGSFRDIQRHRNGTCPIPLIDGRFGLHPWYCGQFRDLLPSGEGDAVMDSIQELFDQIAALDSVVTTDPVFTQYYFPMGTQGLVQVSYSVPQTLYVGELRSQKTVHPSLRPVAQGMLKTLAFDFPTLPLFGDMDAENWTAKRGEQTIAAKKDSPKDAA